MKPLPFPVRLAAGLVAVTAQRAQELPKQLIGLPVTLASQALQVSMRLQQHVTELAIRGDDVLASLHTVEDTPDWATFDEDTADTGAATTGSTRATSRTDTTVEPFMSNGTAHNHSGIGFDNDPWAEEQRALSHDYADGAFDSAVTAQRDAPAVAENPTAGPAGLHNYDALTLPQLRGQLRQFTIRQLTEILHYERAHANRSSFTGMLSRRIENLRGEHGSDSARDDPEH